MTVLDERCAGVFLHPTSLPSPFGVGDLGEDARRWVDILADAKQRWWQVCPLGPAGYGDSPYQSLSSFAGSTLLISLPELVRKGRLKQDELDTYPRLAAGAVDYERVRKEKGRLFDIAFERFAPDAAYRAFCEAESGWLDDYAMYRVVRELNDGRPWYEWEDELRHRRPEALEGVRRVQAKRLGFHKFLQFIFHEQWDSLKAYAVEKGVGIIGDVPYYVAYDSCDTWSSPDVFELDAEGKRLRMGGVPPDYFSADGQLWGNPIYRWDRMARDGYEWWLSRFRRTLSRVDVVRIDHFRGFEAFWAVPAGSTTAKDGVWVKAPGKDFFAALRRDVGSLPFIAEDLGLITARVRSLLKHTRLPGMKVLQFAFDNKPDNPYLPYNIPPESVVYTGTHDNDTSLGWFGSLPEQTRDLVRRYMACDDRAFLDSFLRLAYSSPARLCIVPFQDVLGLGGGNRFNTPGTADGNWRWRFGWEMVEGWMLDRLARFTELYGRAPQAGDATAREAG